MRAQSKIREKPTQSKFTTAQIERYREHLILRVRRAYNNMEKWEQKHKQAMDALAVFTMRYPRRIDEHTEQSK